MEGYGIVPVGQLLLLFAAVVVHEQSREKDEKTKKHFRHLHSVHRVFIQHFVRALFPIGVRQQWRFPLSTPAGVPAVLKFDHSRNAPIMSVIIVIHNIINRDI